MSRTFKIYKDPYGTGSNMYSKSKVEIQPGVTVLVGTNGAGKTSLLRNIQRELEEDSIPNVYFDNLNDGGANARARAGFYGEFDILAASVCSSEGENIVINMGKIAAKIGRAVQIYHDAKEIWLLLDAVDSGLSVDNVVDIKQYLFETMLNDERLKNTEVYILVSANEYEMARGENCLDVQHLRYCKFKTYESYRKYILKSKDLKNKRDHIDKK